MKLIDPAVDDIDSMRGPTRIAASVFAGNVARVTVGSHDGSVWCWGSDFYGQVGLGAGTNVPTQVLGLDTTERLEGRGLAMFAVDGAGKVKAWGEAGYFSVASDSATACGDSTCFKTPTSVASLSGSDEIAAGLLLGFVRSGSAVLGWGRNSNGSLGHPLKTNGDVACPYAASGGDYCNQKPVAVADLP